MKTFKIWILRAFNSLGYTVIKLPLKPQKTSDVVTMIVAGKTIKVHSGNPLRLVYQQNPACNSSLAHVVKLIKEKYPSAWAMDAGANVGDTLAVMRSGTTLPVICVEGDQHCYQLLEENARQFDKVHTFNVFLSDRPGSAIITTEKEGWNTTLLESQNQTNGREIRFETLDRLASRLECQSQVKLLKVDTEGYDIRILRGATTILTEAHPTLAFELNRENIEPLGDDVGVFFEYLTSLGYCHFLIADPNGKPVCILDSNNRSQFLSLYAYSGPGQCICYLDVWAFHKNDETLFLKFIADQKNSKSAEA